MKAQSPDRLADLEARVKRMEDLLFGKRRPGRARTDANADPARSGQNAKPDRNGPAASEAVDGPETRPDPPSVPDPPETPRTGGLSSLSEPVMPDTRAREATERGKPGGMSKLSELSCPTHAREATERGKPAPGRSDALDRLREANHYRARATLARRGGKTGRADALQREAAEIEDAIRADGWQIVAYGSDVVRAR